MLPETHLEPPNDNVIPEAPALQTIDAQSPSLIIAPPAAEAEPDARSHVPPTTPLPQGGVTSCCDHAGGRVQASSNPGVRVPRGRCTERIRDRSAYRGRHGVRALRGNPDAA